MITLNKPNFSLFMDACTNHSTEAACANFSMCEMANKSFEIDQEWALERRKLCMDGVDASKNRLLNSYSANRCAAWGDCSSECTDKLDAIENQINSYQCPEEKKQANSTQEFVELFPTGDTTMIGLWPQSQMANAYGGLGITLCVILLLSRSVGQQFGLPI